MKRWSWVAALGALLVSGGWLMSQEGGDRPREERPPPREGRREDGPPREGRREDGPPREGRPEGRPPREGRPGDRPPMPGGPGRGAGEGRERPDGPGDRPPPPPPPGGPRERVEAGPPGRPPLPSHPGFGAEHFQPGAGAPSFVGPQHPGFGDPGFSAGFEHDEDMAELLRADRELEQKTIQLAHRYRTARPDDKEKVRKELTEVVNKHFEVRQQRRELQVRRMQESLENLRTAIKKRADAREEIVKKRINNLTGEEAGLEF